MKDRDHFLFRIPESLKTGYRPWLGPEYNGWVDEALYGDLSPEQQASPQRLLQADDARVARQRRNLTLRATLGGRPVWLKHFRPSDPIDRFVYGVRPGKAVYAWNAAMALIESGFCTPRPLLGLRAAGPAGGAEGIVGFEEITDHVPLREVLAGQHPESAGRDRIMHDLGACLQRFHDLGFRHRDLRQGNILAGQGSSGWTFCFLDLNRLRLQEPLTAIQRLREVEKLNLPGAGLESFFAGCLPAADSGDMAARYLKRVAYADRLERLPLGRLMRKAWYYSWELRAFSRSRRP